MSSPFPTIGFSLRSLERGDHRKESQLQDATLLNGSRVTVQGLQG